MIPPDHPESADEIVRYVARQAGLSEPLSQRATHLVQAALRSPVLQNLAGRRSWREVPFVLAETDGITEGAIDALAQDGNSACLIDYKTDALASDARAPLEALYSAQLERYAAAVRRAGAITVDRKLLFLKDP